MLINIKVKLFSKLTKIEYKNKQYVAYLTEKPIKGKANQQLIKLLADFFSVPKQNINIKKGFKKTNKIIEILNKNI